MGGGYSNKMLGGKKVNFYTYTMFLEHHSCFFRKLQLNFLLIQIFFWKLEMEVEHTSTDRLKNG